MSYNFYISYAPPDKETAYKLAEAFRDRDATVFMESCEEHDFRGYDNYEREWSEKVRIPIENSCVIVPILSSAYYKDPSAIFELIEATKACKDGRHKIVLYALKSGMQMSPEMYGMIKGLDIVFESRTPLLDEAAKQIVRKHNEFVRELKKRALEEQEEAEHFVQRTQSPTPRVLANHCYYHEDRGVAATCADCGKNLCSECASLYRGQNDNGPRMIICESCYRDRKSTENTGCIAMLICLAILVGLGYFVIKMLSNI